MGCGFRAFGSLTHLAYNIALRWLSRLVFREGNGTVCVLVGRKQNAMVSDRSVRDTLHCTAADLRLVTSTLLSRATRAFIPKWMTTRKLPHFWFYSS